MPKGTGERTSSNALILLEGIRFPCARDALVDYAEEREAPDEIIDLLESLPERDYESMTDVMSAIGQVEAS